MSGFSDSVVGGMGTLARAFIRSKNYVAGVAGWQVSTTGSAEFNDVTTRGKIIAIGSSGSQIVIDPSAVNPLIHFLSANGLNDAFINLVTVNAGAADLGINSGKYTPGDGTPRRMRIFMYGSGTRSANFEVIRESDQAAMGGRVIINDSASFLAFLNNTVVPAIDVSITADATGLTANAPIKLTNNVWDKLNYANGWGDTALAGNPPLRIKRVASPPRHLSLSGRIAGGNTSSGIFIGQMPFNDMLPTRTQIFNVINNTTQANSLAGVLDTNGNVYVYGVLSQDLSICTLIPLDL